MIKRVSGKAIIPWIPAVARLRIQVFRDFPYLYDGSEAYEERYLKRYTTSNGTVVVLVLDDNRVVGASTGMPMYEEDDAVRRPFEKKGYDPDDIFYFGESVLLPEYRGLGYGVRFFEEREAHALALGYKITTFCAVDRPANHQKKPTGYQPLDHFWEKRGYKKLPEMKSTFIWKDLDEAVESPKTLTYWIKYHA